MATASMIDPLAAIGRPPEQRGYTGTGIPPNIHPTVRIEAFVTIDAGTRQATTIGARTWLMKHVHVGHDVQIGHDCELAPLCSVGGHVRIGNHVRVGQGATFKPFIQIGDSARIGMGAVVIRDVPAGEVWAGNPAKPLRRHTQPDLTELEREGWEEWWERSRTDRPGLVGV